MSEEISEFLVEVAKTRTQDARADKVYDWALELNPFNWTAWNGKGRVSSGRKDQEKSLEYYYKSAKGGNSVGAWVNAGIAAFELLRLDDAEEYCRTAIKLDPSNQPAWLQLSAIHIAQEKYQDAVSAAETCYNLNPECPGMIGCHPLFGRAMVRLYLGEELELGWKDYEYRPGRLELLDKMDEYSEWNGQNVEGKDVLVFHEQGIGDQIMFSRYLQDLANLGANVILYSSPDLARLFARSFPYIQVTSGQREIKDMCPDYWVGLGSLRERFGPPKNFPYLQTGASLYPFKQSTKTRVGLCWKGNPQNWQDKYRSFKFEVLEPLLNNFDCEFYSLQKDDKDSKLPNIPEYSKDFLDTVSAIGNLDLVISCDTSMIHAAGAIGTPAIVMLNRNPDFRWGRVGAKNKDRWYGSVEEHRNSVLGQWEVDNIEIRSNPLQHHECPKIPPVVSGQTKYGKMFWHSTCAYVGRALDLYGEYSESEVDMLRYLLKPGDVMIEAGANIGGLTVPLAQHGVLIKAFEPQPQYCSLLEKNLLPYDNAMAHCSALGLDQRYIKIRDIETWRTFAPSWDSEEDWLNVYQTNIDSLEMKRVDLIKIDVDGQELNILKGAENTINKFRPILSVEDDKQNEAYPELIPWLVSHGYRLYQHYAPLYNPKSFKHDVNVFGNTVSWMLLAIPQENKSFREDKMGLGADLHKLRLSKKFV